MHRDATFALHPLVEHAVKQGAAVVAERGAGVRVHLEPVLGPRALYKQHTRYLCLTVGVRYYCNLSEVQIQLLKLYLVMVYWQKEITGVQKLFFCRKNHIKLPKV